MQLPWPLDNGGKIVLFNDLKLLSLEFDIDVVSYIDSSQASHANEYIKKLKNQLPNIQFHQPIKHPVLLGDDIVSKGLIYLKGLIKREPYIVSKYRSREYLNLFSTLLENEMPDIIIVESLAPTSILECIPSHLRRKVRLVYRAYDIFHETTLGYGKEMGFNPIGLAARVDAKIGKKYENHVWRESDLILNVTRRMCDSMKTSDPEMVHKAVYFPVVIDPIDPVELVETSPLSKQLQPKALYIGTVHYPPNLMGLRWFIQECWPKVIEKIPTATLDIVGRGGEQLGVVHPSIKVHRYIDDLTSMYAQSSVFVVPLFSGSGIRLKILDAMNHGLPVVSTTIGYQGLEVTPNQEILVADDASLFAEKVCQLFSQPDQVSKLVSNGRNFIQQNHHLQIAQASVEKIKVLLNHD
jgi:polysaccharide biosynthesis protein PslH